MTSRRDDDKARLVDELSRDARALWVPPPVPRDDADDAERALFSRIEAHERLPKIGGQGVDRRFWGSVGLITAVAAGVLLFAHPRAETSAEVGRVPSTTTPNVTAPPAEPQRPTAPAELTMVTRGAEVRVDGTGVAAREGSLHDGQTIEARGGQAVFAAPGRVDWLLESGTEVGTVRSGAHGAAIVLALRVGAVEAQVVPVPNGEAFAVDVDGVRVAVHGTHLRVAREERGGTRVVVDLSEGVISVGAPPKSGSTVGLLVNAPAHVEFSVADLEGTLRIDHTPASVRPPVDPVLVGALGLSLEPSNPAAPIAATAGAPPPAGIAALGPRSPTAPAPKPTPTEIILAGVHKCAEDKLPVGGGAVTISSMLTVDVNPDGTPFRAGFDPPLVLELQSCVSNVVWATHWTEQGPHRIPIELHR